MTESETTETALQDIDPIVTAAAAAGRSWGAAEATERARVIEAVADALDAAVERLVPIAERETHLPRARLVGELTRTTFQLRLLADEAVKGSCLDIRIDHADPVWPMGAPRPDLRRTKLPIGPVLVFAASNFPFAFSVAGGDTASALAAGCPVIVKAHPGHPVLSRETSTVVQTALASAGAPAGLFALIEGTAAGVAALEHPDVAAGAFTGSIAGGRFLFDVAMRRSVPIPFYGELGSVNPVFVTPEAGKSMREEIVNGFVDSFTLGGGQFCTKPGLLVVPRSAGIAQALAQRELPVDVTLLNEAIADGYRASLAALREQDATTPIAGDGAGGDGLRVSAALLSCDVRDVIDSSELREECFGPAALVVEYDDADQALELAAVLEGQLTATIWGTEDSDVTALVAALAGRSGRVLWNQWPTGVSVTHAQQHGGPYPATTAPLTTSVGTAAIERFLRPVAFQNFPQSLLPASLRDEGPAGTPRRVDEAGADT